MKTPPTHFHSQRVADWQAEWEFLQHSLAHEPHAAQAWWWKLRLRVLTFLIMRYGADPAVRARDHTPHEPTMSPDLFFGERRSAVPRPPETFRNHLRDIAQANDGKPPAPPDFPARWSWPWEWVLAIILGLACVVVCFGLLVVSFIRSLMIGFL